MAVAGSLSKDLTWPVWVGTQEDFARILTAIEKQFRPLLASALAKISARSTELNDANQKELDAWQAIAAEEGDASSQVKRSIDSLLLAKQKIERDAERDQEAERRKFDFELRLTEPDGGNRVFNGNSLEIAELFDGMRFKSFTLAGTTQWRADHKIELRASTTFGFTLTVHSTDENWARAALSYLGEEIRRQVPWWSRLRNPPVIWGILAAIIGTATWLFNGARPLEGTWLLVWAFIVLSYSTGGALAANKFWPVIQILRAGQRPQGSWLIRGTGTVIGGLVIGVLGNWIWIQTTLG